MSRALSDLSPRFRPLASALLTRCIEAGIGITVIDTLRTPEEHQRNLVAGVSWTKHSKHLDGDAIDVCPTDLLAVKGWDPSNPLWARIGDIGESLGLRWGGRWKQRDLGHLEYVAPPSNQVRV